MKKYTPQLSDENSKEIFDPVLIFPDSQWNYTNGKMPNNNDWINYSNDINEDFDDSSYIVDLKNKTLIPIKTGLVKKLWN